MGGTVGFGRRMAAVAACAAVAMGVGAVGERAAAAPAEEGEPTTTAPPDTATPGPGTPGDTTVTTAEGSTTTVAPPAATPTTVPGTTPTTADGPPTTGRPTTTAPPQATTTTRPTTSTTAPWTAYPPPCAALVPAEHIFEVRGRVAVGTLYDDPASDFSVTFTEIRVDGDELVVSMEASHPLTGVSAFGGTKPGETVIVLQGVDATERTIRMQETTGGELHYASFCFADAASVGAAPRPTTTSSTVPGEPRPDPTTGPTPEAPATTGPTTTVTPDDVARRDGRLPTTGSTVAPVLVAGSALVAVGAGLLLLRRRSAA